MMQKLTRQRHEELNELPKGNFQQRKYQLHEMEEPSGGLYKSYKPGKNYLQ